MRCFLQMDDMINDKVAAKEAEIDAIYDERIRNYEERERDLTKQVSVAREQLKELRTSNESTHARLLDHSQRQGAQLVFQVDAI
jgi:homeobox protein cut-like